MLLGGAIIGAYLMSAVLISLVFPDRTPRIDQYTASRLQLNLSSQLALLLNPKSRELHKNVSAVAALSQSPAMSQIVPGVRAASNEKGTYVTVNIDGIEYTEYTITLDGKPVKVRVPKGHVPPTEEMLK